MSRPRAAALALADAHFGKRPVRAVIFTHGHFQAESAIWRNYYLVAAQELRHGLAGSGVVQLGNRDFLRAVPTAMLFDAMSVGFNPAKAGLAVH